MNDTLKDDNIDRIKANCI